MAGNVILSHGTATPTPTPRLTVPGPGGTLTAGPTAPPLRPHKQPTAPRLAATHAQTHAHTGRGAAVVGCGREEAERGEARASAAASADCEVGGRCASGS